MTPPLPANSVLLDENGIVLAISFKDESFSERLGWPDASVIGQPYAAIHQSHDLPLQDVLWGVRRVCTGKSTSFEYRFDLDCQARGEITYQLSAEPSQELDGALLRYLELSNCLTAPDGRVAIYQELVENAAVGVVFQNPKGMIELANPASIDILGLELDTMKTLTRESMPWSVTDTDGHPLTHDRLPSNITLATGEPQHNVVLCIEREDETVVWIRCNSQPLVSSTGEPRGVASTLVDITKERRIQALLREQTERVQMAVESADMGVWEYDPVTRLITWDDKMWCLYGYEENDKKYGKEIFDAWRQAVHPEDVERVIGDVNQVALDGKHKDVDFRAVWKNGLVRHLRSQARVTRDDHGTIVRVLGVTHDITNSVLAEKKLWELAYTDTLTGSYSRAGLNSRLGDAVAHALRKDCSIYVINFGLTRFKEINENYGQAIGDRVLTEVARRGTDLLSSDDTLARVGGDEFVIVLRSLGDGETLDNYIGRMRSRLLRPVNLTDDMVINLDAAVGVSVFPNDGQDPSTLQTHAGLAMRNDRMREHSMYLRYSPEMSKEVSRKFNLKYQLFNAVKDKEFQLYYQPIIDLNHDKVVGCEALIRWRDNTGKFVSPMEFIPVIEESGMICELGKWINITAIRQWKMWQQLAPELHYISVNVSPRQLERPDFLPELVATVKAHGISPENLQLEITEGTFLREYHNECGTLHQLAFHGFRLAIDDFGTGYSSLAYLKRFNVDVIKIDRSFIREIDVDSSDRDIVSAILAMNHKLGFKTLVEGVETEAQSAIVKELGCDAAQGYLYGRPTFADEFAEIYLQNQSVRLASNES